MNFFETLQSAFQNIFSNKMRTFLTTLGIIIGISSVIMITSIGDGLKNAMNDLFSGISYQFAIQMNYNNTDKKPTSKDRLTLKDLSTVKSYPGVKYVSALYSGWGGETIKLLDPTKTKRSSTYGVSPDYYYLNEDELLYGRYISEADVTARSNVVVIYNTTARKVFGKEDVVGEKVSVKGYFGTKKYTIVGVLRNQDEAAEAMYEQWRGEQLFAPITTIMSQYGDKYVDGFQAKVEDKSKLDETLNNIIAMIEKNHGNAGKGFYLPNNPTSQIAQINGMLTILTLFIGFVAAISLLVGGIGVMNIMMVTVTERTREIGIRKSIGARNSDIRVQFIVEAIILTGLGGILGMFIGILGGKGIASLIPPSALANMFGRSMTLEASLSPFAIMFAVGVSCGIGIIFGVYPANKAAKLNPIDALRYE